MYKVQHVAQPRVMSFTLATRSHIGSNTAILSMQ